ncbi:MAG: aldose 1-epimerase family protein [Mesorhizobium sp.]
MGDAIHLASGGSVAVIALEGAEPLIWSVEGRGLLWQADAAYWDRTSPILFPIVGSARNDTIRIDGLRYGMGVHGFAATKEFTLVEQTADTACLILHDDARSRGMFPFAFELEVHYRLEPHALSVSFLVRNTGTTALPYAIGFHPGFRWASGPERDSYRIEFERDEVPQVPVITKEGLFRNRTRHIPLEGRSLSLSDDLLANGALCFLNARSKSLCLVTSDGMISMAVEDFPHFAVWSKRSAPFVCLEAWTGHGDPDDFDGDILGKPSMRLLRPGTEARHAVRLAFSESTLP